jgi:hypothetical protein
MLISGFMYVQHRTAQDKDIRIERLNAKYHLDDIKEVEKQSQVYNTFWWFKN